MKDLLLDNIDLIINAPEGIKKLREMILQLAVRGKLVPQNPDDEPASELLKRIKAEKERLEKEKKIRKQKTMPEIMDDEVPFELPNGWKWCRLGEIGLTQTGTTPPKNDKLNFGNHIPFIGPGDIDNLEVNYTNKGISEYGLKKARLISKSSIIMVCIGGSIGKTALLIKDVTCNQQINAITNYLTDTVNFTFISLRSEYFHEELLKKSSGSATPIINKSKWSEIIIPLPPFTEQKRIVEKIDSLMAFCDELEKLKEEREEKRLSSNKSALQALEKSKDEKEFFNNWKRIEDNFELLFSTPETVKELKQTILQLAVMGKLVPQNPDDEPASELLKKIKAEKERLVKEKKIRKQKPLPVISDDEVPFEVPEGWVWNRLGNLCINIHYGYTDSARHYNTGIKFLRITDIQENDVDWDRVPYCEISEKKYRTCGLNNFDILIARTGGTIGKSYIVENLSIKSVFASYLIRIIPIEKELAKYMKLFLESELYWKQLTEQTQGTGQPNVNATSLKNLIFPLPQFEEQIRIVEKVESLMAICDRFEEKLIQKLDKTEKLVYALVNGT